MATDARTVCMCLKINRVDGTIEGYTEHDKDIAFNIGDGDGEITYDAGTGAIRSALEQTGDVTQVDDSEITVFLQSAGFDPDNIRAGRYDFAAFRMFLVNHQDLTNGRIDLASGWLSQVTIKDEIATCELLGLTSALEREIVRQYGQKCDADFDDSAGDNKCGVRADPPAWAATTAYTVREDRDAKTGSVVKPLAAFNDRHFKCTTAGTSDGSEPAWDTTIGNTTAEGGGSTVVWTTIQALTLVAVVATVVSQREVTLTVSTDAAAPLMIDGRLRWASGTNNALVEEVLSWVLATKTVILKRDMPFTIGVGDSVELVAGCDRTRATCITFDNIENYRGFPDVPGNDWLFRTPGAPTE